MVDLLSTDRLPRRWTDSQPSAVEAGVTTFQLLEDCAQGYEQRICAHGNQTSPGDLLLIATIPAPPKLASCSALRLAAWSPALPLCEYFRRRRQTRSRLSCMQETPTTPGGWRDFCSRLVPVRRCQSRLSDHRRHRHIRTRTRNYHSRPHYFQQRAARRQTARPDLRESGRVYR
jgi:hypothetical protein